MGARFKTAAVFICLVAVVSLRGTAMSQGVPFKTVDKGEISYYSYGEPEFGGAVMEIRDYGTWAWFWKTHTRGIQPAPPLPPVDFFREMVLAALLGYQTSGGGPGIEIAWIEDLLPVRAAWPGRALRVRVREDTRPGMLTVITNPYHIVRVPKGSSVVFERVYDGDLCYDNSECGKGFFCLFQEGSCAGPGTCMPKPEVCTKHYDPVCGCDGRTHGNACGAHAAGASVLHGGRCAAQWGGRENPSPYVEVR